MSEILMKLNAFHELRHKSEINFRVLLEFMNWSLYAHFWQHFRRLIFKLGAV